MRHSLRRTLVLSVLCSAILFSHYCSAQTETFDITTFQPPKDWKRTTGQGYVLFQDAKAGNDAGFCILVVYASRKSSGDPDKDFQQEWKDLVVKPNGTVPEPKIEKEKTPEGWMAVTGVTTLKEKNVEYALMLVSASGFGKVTSVLAKVAGDKYMPVIENFLNTMQLNAGISSQINNNSSGNQIIDNITLNVPSNWKVNKQSSYTQLTFQNDQQKNFCQLTFYNAQPSSGNKQKDFENEWKELVEKNFTVLTLANPASLKDKQGNSFQRLGAKGTDKSSKKYYVQLNVYDCGSAIQSVLAISNTQKDLEQYDQTWQSLITSVKKQTTSVVQNTSTNQSSSIIVNNWGKVYTPMVAYSNDNTVNMAFAGNKRGQYIFKADGTYTFHGENWGGQVKYNDNGNKMKLKNDKEYGLIDEIGNYNVNGNRLTITPTKNTYRIVEADGKLLRTEKLVLDKREYTWQTYYSIGMEETRLVLTATSENFIDGDYSTYEPAVSFPKSFGYALNKNMFFKFLPLNLAPAPSAISINEKILGKWAKSASSPPQYQNGTLLNFVNAGYHKGQYDFKSDGTYSFHGESQLSSNDYGLTDEKGTYSVSGNQVILTPSSATIKKVDANGTLKKTENLSLTKRTYNWQLHYFEGINETDLVLSGISENIVDGGYGSNSQFPNSFLYSREFIPEWRFK